MPYVGKVRPLVGPTEGDGDLRPWTIARLAAASSVVTASTRRAVSFHSLLLSVEARPPKMVMTTLSWS